MKLEKLLESILPHDRIKCRLIDVISYASDAGFYHLQPKAVVQPVTEEEVIKLFQFSHVHKVPLTFRAAGTSLSGQSVTDGILVDLSKFWKNIQVGEEGCSVRVQPGVIGAVVNAHLKRYSRKIGPDPASINSAMMGGILSNNASGMCCGVSRNSYHTTKYIRFILPGGRIFSTENRDDYERFESECSPIFGRIMLLRDEIRRNPDLYSRIRNKYRTKNTVGYSVNSFIDHDHPLDILAHLLIGAEGTLGFISEVVMETVPDYPLKSTGLLYFPDIYAACQAIVPLTVSGADAVELMDRASLRSVEHIKGVPEVLHSLPAAAAALLVEYQGNNEEELRTKTENFLALAPGLSMLYTPEFTVDPVEQAFLWKIRKGMFPAVGAVRKSGTSVILEDIAFPVTKLGDAILDLQKLFRKHNYPNAIIFGHAKDGNIHFVVTQGFDTPSEVERYDRFIQEVVELVVRKYDGALKAEHGTGRNMAPFVETEWGPEIYRVMKSLKEVIDPENLLNPGVIINEDKKAHIQNLKKLPQVEEEVDKCIECGFCEYKCPSRNITLTPRRRIVVRRALKRLKGLGEEKAYSELLGQYQYDGLDTCAVDGLCATACPVEINTGMLVKRLRKENHGELANRLALAVAKNFSLVTSVVRTGVQAAIVVNRILGPNAVLKATRVLKAIFPVFPLWSNQIRPSRGISDAMKKADLSGHPTVAIYFPTCISRSMGGSANHKKNIIDTFISVAEKAGIGIRIPTEIRSSCCGQLFSSKGFNEAFAFTANETVNKLWQWTEGGKYPVVLDITSCTFTLHHCRPVLSDMNRERFDQLIILDSIDFLLDYVLPNASISRKKGEIVLHPVCSIQKMGLEGKLMALAHTLAEKVEVPLSAGCCGMAGDRGFWYPELTQAATAPEANEVRQKQYDGYYSTAKTCEMNMSDAVGHNYESMVYLLDECMDSNCMSAAGLGE